MMDLFELICCKCGKRTLIGNMQVSSWPTVNGAPCCPSCVKKMRDCGWSESIPTENLPAFIAETIEGYENGD